MVWLSAKNDSQIMESNRELRPWIIKLQYYIQMAHIIFRNSVTKDACLSYSVTCKAKL